MTDVKEQIEPTCDGCQCRDSKIIEMTQALRLAQMSLVQGQNIHGRISANGPTIGDVIIKALK